MAPGTAPAVADNGAASNLSVDVNWLMTWLRQAEPEWKESEPAASRQMQWLTLLPPVSAVQVLPAEVPTDPRVGPIEGTPLPTMPVPPDEVPTDPRLGRIEGTPLPTIQVLPAEITADPGRGPIEGTPHPAIQVLPAAATTEAAELEPAVADEDRDAPDQLPVTGPIVADVVQPLMTVLVSHPVSGTFETIVDTGAPQPMESRKTPILAADVEVPQLTEKPFAAPTKADKGELIWAADLVVAEKVEPASREKGIAVATAPRRAGSESGAREQSEGEQRQGEKQTAPPAAEKKLDRPAPVEPAEPARIERHAPEATKHEVPGPGVVVPVSVRAESANGGIETRRLPSTSTSTLPVRSGPPRLRPSISTCRPRRDPATRERFASR